VVETASDELSKTHRFKKFAPNSPERLGGFNPLNAMVSATDFNQRSDILVDALADHECTN